MSGSIPHSIEALRFTQDRSPVSESSLANARPEDTSNATQTRASSDYVVSLSEEAQDLQAQESQTSAAQDASETEENGRTDEDAQQEDDSSNSQLTEEEQQEVEDLKARDKEVRIHEQAHASIGGQYASSPSYTYEQGPDGQRYITDGEVPIDISKVSGNPQATIDKMEQVYRAALAPAEPSSADRSIANEAQANITEARAELAKQAQDTDSNDVNPGTAGDNDNDSDDAQPPYSNSTGRSTFEAASPYRNSPNAQGGLIDLIA